MNRHIEIHIDRIVLEGFDHLNKKELNFLIQEHLTKLISQIGLPHGLNSQAYHRKIDGGRINLNAKTETNILGEKIAHGIMNGINSTQ